MIQKLIAWYFKRVLKWEDIPVVLEKKAYDQLIKAASNSVLLALKNYSLTEKLKEIGYDFETNDVYNPDYEQTFAEFTEDGEWETALDCLDEKPDDPDKLN